MRTTCFWDQVAESHGSEGCETKVKGIYESPAFSSIIQEGSERIVEEKDAQHTKDRYGGSCMAGTIMEIVPILFSLFQTMKGQHLPINLSSRVVLSGVCASHPMNFPQSVTKTAANNFPAKWISMSAPGIPSRENRTRNIRPSVVLGVRFP